MSGHIERTTVRLDSGLLAAARSFARDNGTTLTALIQKGLESALREGRPARRKKIVLPVSREKGGILPGVDLNNSAALLDILEGRA
jgi:hypothetical protein